MSISDRVCDFVKRINDAYINDEIYVSIHISRCVSFETKSR